MMMGLAPLTGWLIELALHPQRALKLDESGWDLLIRLARRANLLARLAHELDTHTLLDAVPEAPRAHLIAARVLSARQQIAVTREIEALQTALAPIGVPLVLLKGSAYLAAGDDTAAGRLFGDIDILVPEVQLAAAESRLMQAGWHRLPQSHYDEQYYRRWMHELPPMQHRTRASGLDVHHNLLPRTAHRPPDARHLFDTLAPTAQPGVFVLAPIDRVLHSACHWFHESEHHNGLRDALDIKRLIEAHAHTADFWPRLFARARQLHLEAALDAALAVCATHLQLHLPAPHRPRRRATLLSHSLTPRHPLADTRVTTLARALMFLRGHALRLPPHLLAWHLCHKALARGQGMEPSRTTPV